MALPSNFDTNCMLEPHHIECFKGMQPTLHGGTERSPVRSLAWGNLKFYFCVKIRTELLQYNEFIYHCGDQKCSLNIKPSKKKKKKFSFKNFFIFIFSLFL